MSSLVSSMSATMTRLQMNKQEQSHKHRILRRFLRQNEVQHDIAVKTERSLAQWYVQKNDWIAFKDVEALNQISASVRAALKQELYEKHLVSHSFFRMVAMIHKDIMQQTCSECVERVDLAPADELFSCGEEATGAYLVIHGSFQYTQADAAVDVLGGRWLSEASLWCSWLHVGSLKAVSSGHLLTVNAERFLKVATRHRVLREVVSEYGRAFHTRTVMSGPPQSPWPSDLEVALADYAEIVVSMSQSLKVMISLLALRHLPGRFLNFKQNRHAALAQEVAGGRCTLIQKGTGEVERLVMLATLRIQRKDGMRLVRLAELVEDGAHISMEVACKAPGSKLRPKELPQDAANRIVVSEFAPFAANMRLTGVHRQVESSMSSKYNVQTRYCKTFCMMSLIGDGPHEEAVERSTTRNDRPSFRPSSMSLGGGFRVHQQRSRTAGSAVFSQRASAQWMKKQSLEAAWKLVGWEVRVLLGPPRNKDARRIAPQDSGPSSYVYAWLPEAQFALFATPEGEQALRAVLASVDFAGLLEARAEEGPSAWLVASASQPPALVQNASGPSALVSNVTVIKQAAPEATSVSEAQAGAWMSESTESSAASDVWFAPM